MAVMDGCKGQLKVPVIEERECPVCGEIIEVYTVAGRISEDEKCPKCGFVLTADAPYTYKTRMEIEWEENHK